TLIRPADQAIPRWQFSLLHFVWWFPASLLILPGLLFALRKIIQPQEFTFADALPICWIAAGLLCLVLPNHHSIYSSISMWSAVALWSALAWERTPRSLQIFGLSLFA